MFTLTKYLLVAVSFGLITYVQGSSTVVYLTDTELLALLQVVFNQIGNTTLIPITLLQQYGLATASVIEFLQNMGYTIF
jgi:hypothetical protein